MFNEYLERIWGQVRHAMMLCHYLEFARCEPGQPSLVSLVKNPRVSLTHVLPQPVSLAGKTHEVNKLSIENTLLQSSTSKTNILFRNDAQSLEISEGI